jgi:integrase
MVRIGEMLDRWHAVKKAEHEAGRLSLASIINISDVLRYTEPIRSVRLRKLDVETYLSEIPGSYPHRVRSVLAQAADYAGVAPNPFRRVKVPVKPNRVTAVPSLETVHQLAALCREYEPLVIGLAASGMRFGEGIALEPRHVNGRQVTVSQAFDSREKRVRGTKTGNVRKLLVAAFGAEAFERQPFDGSPYLFSRSRPPVTTYFHSAYWQPAKRELGVPWRVHDLRHFYATHMLAAGVPVATVASWLGHSSALTTLRVYAGFVEEDFSAWAERV